MDISDLKGKAVLITGASTGIGAALAREFARQGAWVGLHYNASQDAAQALVAEIEAAGGRGGGADPGRHVQGGRRAGGGGSGGGGIRAAGRADQQRGQHGAPGALRTGQRGGL